MISHYNGGAAEVGIESAHFYPFRQKVLKPLQMSFGSAGREMVDEFRERYERCAFVQGLSAGTV